MVIEGGEDWWLRAYGLGLMTRETCLREDEARHRVLSCFSE